MYGLLVNMFAIRYLWEGIQNYTDISISKHAITLLLQILYRLFLTFRDTQYQYRWYNIGFLLCICLMVLQLIGNFFWNYYYAIGDDGNVLLWSFIIYFTDPAYCVIITYLFLRKLYQVWFSLSVQSDFMSLISTYCVDTVLWL